MAEMKIQERIMLKDNPLILIVDDEIYMCNALRRILKQAGYRIIAATDGETALRLTEKKKPDVILLDVMMPGMDGREVCRRVRQLNTGTQIIYFTAKIDLVDPSRTIESYKEADAVISKPATGKQILSKVNSVLRCLESANHSKELVPVKERASSSQRKS